MSTGFVFFYTTHVHKSHCLFSSGSLPNIPWIVSECLPRNKELRDALECKLRQVVRRPQTWLGSRNLWDSSAMYVVNVGWLYVLFLPSEYSLFICLWVVRSFVQTIIGAHIVFFRQYTTYSLVIPSKQYLRYIAFEFVLSIHRFSIFLSNQLFQSEKKPITLQRIPQWAEHQFRGEKYE